MSQDSEFAPPDDSVCPSCAVALTEANVFRIDVTDPKDTQPWDRTPDDEPRVYVLYCTDCVLGGRAEVEP